VAAFESWVALDADGRVGWLRGVSS